MNRFTLRQLEYFVSCFDCGSIAGAAAALNISQPTISVALNKLEDQLGVQLFIRHQSLGISATASAEKLIYSARSLLAQSIDWQRQATMTGAGIEGVLNLGSFTTLAPAFLPRLIKTLKIKFPGIELNLNENTQEKLIDLLYSGQIEMALLYDLNLPNDVRKSQLAQVTPYAALSADHPLAKKEIVTLTDLVQQPMILLDVQPSREYFLNLFRANNLAPKIAYSSSSLEMVRGLVGCGLGYSLLVTRPHGDLTYDGQPLCIKPLGGNILKSEVVLASLDKLKPTRIMESFEKITKDFYSTSEN